MGFTPVFVPVCVIPLLFVRVSLRPVEPVDGDGLGDGDGAGDGLNVGEDPGVFGLKVPAFPPPTEGKVTPLSKFWPARLLLTLLGIAP